ncbi:diguanylate cyclase [Ketobacter sp.]|uniref:diguanylate cyclase n=1 Tax=Ketobacter sp. TaxID=2083498 RepID=UPI000F29ABB4|nr:diguanylate cyclase [Ketobacter sp.]RLU01087.1 MAG: diguanylate cyclase [Ketobacter sp.]
MRAMIIDISKSLSVLLNQHLASQQIKSLTLTRGDEALDMLKRARCDLVITAMYLEDMEGIEFVRALRKLENQQNTHVVMLTTEESRDILSRAMKAGVNELFPKQKLDTVLEHITSWSQKVRLQQTSGSILYVEDNQSTALLVCELLKNSGYKVQQVGTGLAALECMDQHKFDLLLVDYILEGDMTGLELVKTLRTRASPIETPILMLSAQESEDIKVEILRSGANDYLSKVASRDEMLARINNLIRTKRLFEQVQYQQQKLQHLAMTDQLTGLHNRHYLFEAAPQKLSEAQRHRFPVALLIVDLDKFKDINDLHGHATGDSVLKEAAQLLRNQCRREDIVARFGGEEFVILLSHCDRQQALDKAESIRLALEQLNPAQLTVTGSFGVACCQAGGRNSFNDLFSDADSAVYTAKHNGRNRVECLEKAAPQVG